MSSALPAALGSDRVTRQARAVFLVSVAVTLGLWISPWAASVGYPLMLLSTIAHEMGHGIAAIVVGGDFESFRVYPDGSGVAMTSVSDTRLARAAVSAGGLVGPALIAMLFFALGRRPRAARGALLVVGLALLAVDALLVRNVFGGVFIGVVGLAFVAIAWKVPALSQVGLVFIGVQLALSVFSRGDYLFTDVAETANGNMPSDVSHMADALFLPYWFWGLACGLVSVLALLAGAMTLLRSKK